jgi:predicted transcriptional regulator
MRLPSELDSRAKLKKSFKFSLEKLRETVGTRIAEVAEYNKGSVQATEQITMKAVNIWLEFGEQRCRVLVIEKRPNSAVVDEKVNKAVNLLVLPQLKRYGKSDGQNLDIEEVIKGCEGESISLNEV